MPAKRKPKPRVVRCWALWWKHAELMTVYGSREASERKLADLMFPEDYTLTRVEVRELLAPKRRSKAKQ